MKKIYILLFALITFSGFSQTINMPSGSTNTVMCSGTFYDSGGSGSNYSASETRTLTFCPAVAGDKMQLLFTAFNIENNSDFMYVFDGTNTSAPSLGVYTGTNSPGTVQATSSNPSGCITIRFTSNFFTQTAGWAASISCFTPCQTINAVFNSSIPAASGGAIKICQGQSVQFTGSGTFSNSGAGAVYTWDFDNGTTGNGTTATATYTAPGVYVVNLDINVGGCSNNNKIEKVVHVSTTPTFTTSASSNTICTGQTATITGVAQPVPFTRSCTPSLSGTTFLPDGSGVSYSTCIDVNCYPTGQAVVSANDIQSICLNMEHSYSGDLDMIIQCPNGQSVSLKNYPGGGSTNLGAPFLNGFSDNAAGPGAGFNYCFSMSGTVLLVNAPTVNTITTGPNGGSSEASFAAGTYSPAASFAGLVGCPLNGNWCIKVTDHLAVNNGYIFNWAVNFSPAITPTNYSFTPTIASQTWTPDPTITSTNGNSITIQPFTTGTKCYTFTATDNFGCSYNTTKCITVTPGPTVTVTNATICPGTSTVLTAAGATSYSWNTGATTSTISVSPISTSNYTVTGTSGLCSTIKESTVTISATPTVVVTNTAICPGGTVTLTAGGATTYSWSTGATTSTIAVSPASATVYTVTGTTNGCSDTKTVSVSINPIPTTTASTTGTLTCTNFSVNLNSTLAGVNYTWTAPAGGNVVSVNAQATQVSGSPGIYTLTVQNATGCTYSTTTSVTQNTVAPTVTVSGTQTITCSVPTVTITGSATPSTCTVVWSGGVSSGVNSYTATASAANIYTLTVTNPQNGCVNSATTQIVQSAGIPSVIASVTNSLSCTTLTAQVVATTTSSPVSYNWTGPGITAGATTASATVNAGGQYTVVVTNTVTACSTTITASVVQNTISPIVSSASSGTLTCVTVTVNASATTTTTPVSYNWSGTGITSPTNISTITVNQAGTFNYTVTNTSNGCFTTGSQAVTQNTIVPTVTVSGTQTITCIAPTVTLTGSSTPSTCIPVWSGGVTSGANSFTATATAANNYTLTVTDPVNGCVNSMTTQIASSVNVPTVITSVSNSLSCITTTAQVAATTTAAPVSYNWSGTGITAGVGTGSITVNQGGIFNYTVTNTSNGCIAIGTQAVTQNTTVPTVTVSGTQTITCAAPTVTLTGSATPSTCTPVWSGGVVSGANSYTATAASANVYTLTVTDPNNGCVSSATTEVVSSSGIPVVIASVTNSLSCTTLTTQVIASTTTTPVSYNWSGTGITSATNISTITVNQPGTFNYTVTNTDNGCVTMGSQAVTQNTTAPTLTVSGTQTITCGAPSVTLTGSATPSTCTPVWTGGVVSGANSYTATAASANVYTLTVTDPDNGCVNSATTQVVPSVGMPSVSTSVTNSLSCIVTSAQVVATTTMTPVSYNWTGPNITGGASTPTATVNGPGTYTIVVTNTSSSCSTTVTIGVTQNTVSPVVNANTSGVLSCTLASVNVIASTTTTPVSYNWSGTGITSATNISTITVNQPGTFNYTVTNTDNGCVTMGSQAVTQNTAAPTLTVTASNPTICPLGNSTLTVAGATSYTWNSSTTLNTTNGAIVIASPTATETYTVIGSIGTCTNSAQVTVNVVSNPTITVLSNTTICFGTSAALSANGANTYTWSPFTNLSSSTGANVNANPANTQIYTVTGTSIFGCNGSTTVTVTVIPNPTITASANPTIICDGSSTTLNANGASSYTWIPSVNVTNPNANTTSASPIVTTVYTVTGTNGTAPNLCSATKTVVVNVQPKTVALTYTVDPICYGSSTTIYAHGGNSYTWTPLSGAIEDRFDSTTVVKPLATTIYTVTVTKNGLCPGTGTVEVVVHPLPIVNAGADTTINIDETVTLFGTGNTQVGFLSPDTYPLNCNLCPVITVNPKETTCFILKGTNSFGCTAFDEVCVTVTKDYGIYVPNAFTPNGDGLNELFMPVGYGIAEMDLYVFDRWGKQIFASDDTHPGWDGTYNGQLCKQDVYAYKAEIKAMSGKIIIKYGHVTLMPKLK